MMKCEIDRNAPVTAVEKVALFALAMWPLLFVLAMGAICGGCGKSVDVEGKGMYANANSGVVGIGSFEVVTVPDGNEAARIQYSEDTAWLSPTTKTHAFKINLCGTNSVDQVGGIVSNICQAFIATAPAIAAVNAGVEVTTATSGPGAVVSSALSGSGWTNAVKAAGDAASAVKAVASSTNAVEAVAVPVPVSNAVESVSVGTNAVEAVKGE